MQYSRKDMDITKKSTHSGCPQPVLCAGMWDMRLQTVHIYVVYVILWASHMHCRENDSLKHMPCQKNLM